MNNEISYNIAMFAYNEETNLKMSLEAVFANSNSSLKTVYLLANGCTDKTVELAYSLKQEHSFDKLEIVEIKLGDKCNAWNVYVHDIADNVDCHFFIDADCIFSKNCFPLLATKLYESASQVNIIAGMPLTGRNVKLYQSLVTTKSCFFGNLYGMHKHYLTMIREKSFRLPIGLNWIDSFLTKAANTDIQFLDHNLVNRVTHLENVGFNFDSLSPFKIDDITLYKNRIARYELGKIQEIYLDQLAFSNWPTDMHGINVDIKANFEAKTKQLGAIKKYLVKRRLNNLINKYSSANKLKVLA
jgi:hypothetical protein